MADTSGLIVATPAADDPVNELSQEDLAHVTMLYFGDASALPDDLVTQIRSDITDVVGQGDPFEARVSGVALLGPDKASVLLLESEELTGIRQVLCESNAVREAYMMADRQFPVWVPHLTITYGGPIVESPPLTVMIDALALWLGEDRVSYPLQETEPAADDVLAAGTSIPPVYCPDDLPLAMAFADANPHARWYVEKRAVAFGLTVPDQWAVA